MSYQQLTKHFRRISHFEHTLAMLHWDEATMMPTGGGKVRIEAVTTLAGMIHQLTADPRIYDWLDKAENEDLSEAQCANCREIRRTTLHATALEPELIEAFNKAIGHCEQAWRVQREANDWDAHLPLLEAVFRLNRERGQALSQALQLCPYDAMLELHEPGLRMDMIDPMFNELASFLPSVLESNCVYQQSQAPVIKPHGPFSITAQRALGLKLMTQLGFDFNHGRLDISHHPFCGGVPQDVRITTRYDENDFTSSLMGILHETGHAKYEQGLPEDYIDQPVGQPRGYGIHESQSLLQEMQICRSRSFLQLITPEIQKAFPSQSKTQPNAFTVDNLYQLYTQVKPDFIRVDADEVTYPLHIMLRYQLEKDLMRGDLAVKDIPDAWDQQMQKLLGLRTEKNYRNGCMQDIHWASGAVGYFPIYTYGAIAAAQIFQAATDALGDVDTLIAQGEFKPLNDWLRKNIWSQGSLLESNALIQQATGQALTLDAFKQHIEQRYLGASI